MNFQLDVGTLIISLIIGNIISIILLITEQIHKPKEKYDWLLIAGRGFQLIGWILIGQRGSIMDVWSCTVGNIIYINGLALESVALASLKAVITRKWYIVYGVIVGVICFCHVVFYAEPLKIIIATFPFIGLFALIPGVVLLYSKKNSSLMQKFIGWIYVSCFFVALWRACYALNLKKYSIFMSDTPHASSFIMLNFILFTGSMGYILIKKEYQNMELVSMNARLNKEKEMVAYYEAEIRRKEIERAELLVLQAQIKPHFMQNTLGAVGHFCRVDTEKAQMLIRNLAIYLRSTFELTDDLVLVEKELEIVKVYLEIELVRFQSRLNIHYEIQGNLEGCMIPPFTLQPLVENAVHHAIAARRKGGTVTILIKGEKKGFFFAVEDDGPGIPEEIIQAVKNGTVREGQGIGLTNIYRRLQYICGSELVIVSKLGNGTRISFYIPRGIVNSEKCESAPDFQ